MAKKKARRQRDRDIPLSLYPLSAEEALAGALQVKPPPKSTTSKKKQRR